MFSIIEGRQCITIAAGVHTSRHRATWLLKHLLSKGVPGTYCTDGKPVYVLLAGRCLNGFQLVNGRCYRLVKYLLTDNRSWPRARAACLNLNADLACIRTARQAAAADAIRKVGPAANTGGGGGGAWRITIIRNGHEWTFILIIINE